MTVTPFRRPEKPGNQPSHPPMFNIPPVTMYALVLIVAVYVVLWILPPHLQEFWGYNLAFVAKRYTVAGAFDIYAITSPFTHLFLHGGWLHLAMNGMMFLAFGAASERMLGARKAVALFFLCGVVGAFTQFVLAPTSPIPMIGASGALSGLFAAVILRLQKSGQMPVGKWGIWGIAAMWVGLSFVTALVGGAVGIGNVAWAAHAGGFLAGIFAMRLNYFKY